jgi:hypothetical protein
MGEIGIKGCRTQAVVQFLQQAAGLRWRQRPESRAVDEWAAAVEEEARAKVKVTQRSTVMVDFTSFGIGGGEAWVRAHLHPRPGSIIGAK